jgi:hypothetical protein
LYNFVPAPAHSLRALQARDPSPKSRFGTRYITLARRPVVALEGDPVSRTATNG